MNGPEQPTARTLDDDQLRAFNTEQICEKEWAVLKPVFDERFANREFSFVDVGGGNGSFADMLLAAYPRARGVVLDPAEILLSENKPHPRKEVKLARAESMDELFGERKFDLILFNWILHHLVLDSYAKTIELQRAVILKARRLLERGGVISVLENLYEGNVVDAVPSRLIFELTSSKLLKPLVRRLGANTAGTGVCFRSRTAWEKDATWAGLRVAKFIEMTPKPIGAVKELLLQVKFVGHGFFWLEPATLPQVASPDAANPERYAEARRGATAQLASVYSGNSSRSG
ncbi:MAG TPA: class I SAM-dependent methyltransferase [Myxococcales bacterium]|nr:class I SAM-dependent methyltransferase [Myxococcales bacterium]